VIPQQLRVALGITADTFLQLTQSGNDLLIRPISNFITKTDIESTYQEILKKTAGSWVDDNWQETRKRRKKIELSATKKARIPW